MRGRKDIARDGEATRFTPGRSGNPGGRPKAERDVLGVARAHSVEAIHALVRVMREGRPSEVRAAAADILDRALGRPKQVADVTMRRELREMSDDELLAVIRGASEQPDESAIH